MRSIFVFILFVTTHINAQYKSNGFVLDKETLEPIEFVDVYNNLNHSITNSEGRYEFVSESDVINFNILGYEIVEKTIPELSSDTIYLKRKIFELEDVTVTDEVSFLKNSANSIDNNYPFNLYSNAFFMRSLLKRDGKIIKLQDINGLISRKALLATSKKPMPKNNYEVQIFNMRKVGGIVENDIYFEMFDFEKLLTVLSSIYVSTKAYRFQKKSLKNGDYVKVEFLPKESSSYTSKGYYLVNLSDLAFSQFYLEDISKDRPYIEKRGIRYRTTYFEVLVKFRKKKDNMYYIDKAKINATVELINEDSEKFFYEASYDWIEMNETENRKIDSNVSLKRDIFKIDKVYNQEFWDRQNILMLTKEMKDFIDNDSSENNDYKLKSVLD